MQIAIQAMGIAFTDTLHKQVERKLRFALGPVSAKLSRVDVCFVDENGPRGGVDKRCTLRIKIPGANPVVIEQQEADLHVALARAAERAGRVVARRLDKYNSSYSSRRQSIPAHDDDHQSPAC